MIKIRLDTLLRERGQTAYWLSKQSGVRYATIWNLARGRAGRLSLAALDSICAALECQVGDLLVRVANPSTRKRGK